MAMTLEPCPFCGTADMDTCNPDGVFPDGGPHGYFVARCGNPDCAAEVSKQGREETIAAWNRRAHLTQPAQAVDVSDAVVSAAVEAWNAAPALGREEDDENAMRAAIETALSALSVPAIAVTNALAEKVLTAYATICIDRHHDDAPESARISAMREALTRAISVEKAGPVGDGKYRLLGPGDVIEPDDEFIADNAVDWVPVKSNQGAANLFVGMQYRLGTLKQARRRLPAPDKEGEG